MITVIVSTRNFSWIVAAEDGCDGVADISDNVDAVVVVIIVVAVAFGVISAGVTSMGSGGGSSSVNSLINH